MSGSLRLAPSRARSLPASAPCTPGCRGLAPSGCPRPPGLTPGFPPTALSLARSPLLVDRQVSQQVERVEPLERRSSVPFSPAPGAPPGSPRAVPSPARYHPAPGPVSPGYSGRSRRFPCRPTPRIARASLRTPLPLARYRPGPFSIPSPRAPSPAPAISGSPLASARSSHLIPSLR